MSARDTADKPQYPKCQHCASVAHYGAPLYHAVVTGPGVGENPKLIRVHGYCVQPMLKGMVTGYAITVTV